MSTPPSHRPTTTLRPNLHPPTTTILDGTDAHQSPLFEEKRTSLLDLVRDGLARSGKTTVLYRVVVCGGVAKGADKAEIGGHYQRFFKQYQAETDLITGLLVVFEHIWYHFLEASAKVTYAFLRDLSRLTALTNIKVVLISDDISNRFYPFWASRIIEKRPDEQEVDADDVVGAENVVETLGTLCVNLCGVGTGLGAMGKADLKQALDELSTQFKDLLPKSAVVHHIINAKNVMGIDEWLEIYDSHHNFVLESELVWPAQNTLTVP